MQKFFTLILLTLSLSAAAQSNWEFQQLNEVKVVVGTDTLRQPWVGGLNSPVFSTIKLNNDAAEDLYVFDRNTKKSFTFLADNASGTWKWKYAPEYEVFFPKKMEHWVLLRDFNGDGRKDLFTGDDDGTWLYQNDTPVNGQLSFKATPRALKFGFNSPMKLGSYVLPALTDVDNDGDLDILAFDNPDAKTVYYYKNRRVDLNYHSDSLTFIRETEFWGRFNRCSLGCNSFEFGTITCKAAAQMHGGGGSILALDLDGDNDKDILVGTDMCPELVKLSNSGTTTLANMNQAGFSANYPTGTTPASMANFPAAYYEDVNFDGKKDLLVSPYLADNLDNANFAQSVWLYQNNAASATAAPVFAYNKNNFLQDQMFDVGLEAIPVFTDLDADGDLDLLVGNFADYRTGTNQYRSAVSLYTNVGSISKPVFKLTDPDYLQFSQADLKGISLQFADMNGDGSKDLIFKYRDTGGANGNIGFIPNTAQPNQPYAFSRASQVILGISINAADSPFFYDIDGDGDLDLLLGTDKTGLSAASGAIHYIRRTGVDPASFASWQLVNDKFGNIPRITGRENVCPIIADLNNDGKPDLVTGDDSGILRIYPNVLVNLNATLTSYSTLLPNSLTGTTLETNFGPNLQLAVADLDNDQKPEILVGAKGGGLSYLKNNSQLLGVKKDLNPLKFKVFPNPASEIVTVTCQEKVKATIYDLAGKKVLESATGFSEMLQLNVAGLKPGVYFLKIITPDRKSAGRNFIVQP